MVGRRHGRGLVGIVARCVFYGALAFVFLFCGALVLDSAVRPVSTLMMGRWISGRSYERDYVRLDQIAPVAVASIVASEDGQFCRNDGVDWDALRGVLHEADEDGPSRGASTITMQTAKNLFLWPGRSAIRKGIEIAVALVLGKAWTKSHTIEVYLNIAEWGDGIFGIEAAARHYFHKSARRLDARQAALLATALPNPIVRDAAHPLPLHARLAGRLMTRAAGSPRLIDCLPDWDRTLDRVLDPALSPVLDDRP